MPLIHPKPSFKHLCGGPLFHSFLFQPNQSCPEQLAHVLAYPSCFWGLHRKRIILYRLKNSSLKCIVTRLSDVAFSLRSKCRELRFTLD